jgi:alpha-tubulin suppressor-like RCC1 family protein
VYCWGSNTDLQVGAGSATLDGVLAPIEVDRVVGATGIACGYNFSCAVLSDGSVSCWGSSAYGELGLAGGSSLPPRRLDGLADIQTVAAGAYHACAATLAGDVYCWGRGSLGDGSDGDHPEPGRVVMPTGVTQLAATDDTTCALSGTDVWCWGANAAHPSGAYVPLPALVLAEATAVSIGAAGCGLGLDRRLRCWGGWVGDGTSALRRSPVTLAAPVEVLQVASNGANAACALASGGLWCWGQNLNGEVGDGTTEERPSPTLVSP